MLKVTVKDGTGAGRRRVKQLVAWTHRCADTTVRLPGHVYSCPCGARRPT